MSCYIPMAYLRKLPDAASGEENTMRRRQLSYYHVHMIPGGPFRSNFSRFIYRRLKNMKDEEEKYRIKPRKKYQRQVWLKDGKAIIVDPLDPSESKEE
jgi:hypothetical protein